MSETTPTELLVGAQIRRAATAGVSIVVLRRGDSNSGAIILKINRLDGTARVLMQIRDDEELVWSPAGRSDPMPEREADQYLEEQAAFDPDSWLIEIEDKSGRIWFPGRVIGS